MGLELVKDVGPAVAVAIIVINQLFALLRSTAGNAREDYKHLEGKLDELADKVSGFAIVNTKLTEQLGYSARRDVEFYDRQLPAMLKRATARDWRIDQNRDAINEVRAHLKLPLTSHTPPMGVPVVQIEDGPAHSVSALEAVNKTKKE